MQPEAPQNSNHDPAKGLPAVTPPSGRHIVQLFVVPGLIVTVAVLILLGFSWLVGGESAPQQLLERLESDNPDVRWRAANDLAQRLKRDDQLASDPQVALKLTTRLQQALDDYDRATRDLAERQAKATGEADLARESKALQARRKDIQFLAPCVGTLMLPTGAPLLQQLALRTTGPDQKSVALLRRQAVWALANLGENMRRYDGLPEQRKQAVVAELKKLEASSNPPQREWVSRTLSYLQGTGQLGVIETLAESAQADDPFQRKLVALALTFWNGDEQENQLAERTLVRLTQDDGHGVAIEIGEDD